MRNPADPVVRAATPEGPVPGERVARQVQAWSAEPWALDFFATMRRLEALAAPAPRWGEAALPKAEAVRVGQAPSLAFAPAGIAGFEPASDATPVPRLRQHFFGYLGPNGPLPLHLSDLVRDRVHNHGDPTLLAFLDGFAHRFALHFYRAWAQPRAAVSLDRPGEDAWRRWVGALIGIGTRARQQRDAIADDARLHFSGWLARRVHNAEGVEQVLGGYFHVPVRLLPWTGHWLPIAPQERSYLGGPPAPGQAQRTDAASRLGAGAVLGCRVWDRQHRVRLRLGPLDLPRYRQFLPSGPALPALADWMRQLLGDELYWDAQLVLARQEVPPTRLGAARGNAPRLGWMAWLGTQPRSRDAADVRVHAPARTRAGRGGQPSGQGAADPPSHPFREVQAHE